MSGDARASALPHPPPLSSTPSISAPPALSSSVVVPPIHRHLAFTSTKPPFVNPNDYHRFSFNNTNNNPIVVNNTRLIIADQEVEAIVVRSPQLKRKSTLENREFESSQSTNSPFMTPVSAKGGGRMYNRSKASRRPISLLLKDL